MTNLSATEKNQIEDAVREVFEAGCAAWNRADLDGYLASYWDSERTRWISGGSVRRGREAIAAAYKERFATGGTMGQLSIAELEIEVLTPTDALAFGRWQLDMGTSSSTGFFTVQLKNIDGAWLFVLDHASSAG